MPDPSPSSTLRVLNSNFYHDPLPDSYLVHCV